MRVPIVFVLATISCAHAAAPHARAARAVSLVNEDKQAELARLVHDTPASERDALVHTVIEALLPRLEPAYEQRGEHYSIDASTRGLVALGSLSMPADRIRIGRALVRWVMLDPRQHWLGETTLAQLAALTSDAEVAAAITDSTTAVMIARSLHDRRDPIGDVIATRVGALVDDDLARGADRQDTLQLFRALQLLDRPAGNRFLVDVAGRPSVDPSLQADALEAVGHATWPERRDQMVQIALTTKSEDARSYALYHVAHDPPTTQPLPAGALPALWKLFDAAPDPDPRLHALTGAALVALDAEHVVLDLARRVAAGHQPFSRSDLEIWACALEGQSAPPRDTLRSLAAHRAPAVRAFALLAFAVLATPDDVAAIGARAADRGELDGESWQRYPTVGKLADSLITSKYDPASNGDPRLCREYVGR